MRLCGPFLACPAGCHLVALLGVADAACAVVFILYGPVRWAAVVPLALGFLAGSRLGPSLARRIPGNALHTVVAMGGLGLAAYLWLKPSTSAQPDESAERSTRPRWPTHPTDPRAGQRAQPHRRPRHRRWHLRTGTTAAVTAAPHASAVARPLLWEARPGASQLGYGPAGLARAYELRGWQHRAEPAG
jgi:hypothetical protein